MSKGKWGALIVVLLLAPPAAGSVAIEEEFIADLNSAVWSAWSNGGGEATVDPVSGWVVLRSGVLDGGGTTVQSIATFDPSKPVRAWIRCKTPAPLVLHENDRTFWGLATVGSGGDAWVAGYDLTPDSEGNSVLRAYVRNGQLEAEQSVDYDDWSILTEYSIELYGGTARFFIAGTMVWEYSGVEVPAIPLHQRLDRTSPGSDRYFYVDRVVVTTGELQGWELASTYLGEPGSTSAVAVADYNADGLNDLYLVKRGGMNQLLRNDGCNGLDPSFYDHTPSALRFTAESLAANGASFDNDSDPDVYVSILGAQGKLFRNDGTDSFVDVTPAALHLTGGGGVSWIDWDSDGDLDIAAGDTNGLHLLRNDGNLVFTDLHSTNPVFLRNGLRSSSWADYDNDGDPDVAFHGHPWGVALARNDGGGTFTDVTPSAIATATDNDKTRGVEWGDFNNDGLLDFYYVSEDGGNFLARNDGSDSFTLLSDGPLGQRGDYTGVQSGDYDNDGWLDLFVSGASDSSLVIRNLGGSAFVAVKADLVTADSAACFVPWDVNDDGRLDLLVPGLGAESRFLLNHNDNDNHYLRIRLVGAPGNATGIGARITAVAGGQNLIRFVNSGSGALAGEVQEIHFGLGGHQVVESLTVAWPRGRIQTFVNLAADQILTIFECQAGATFLLSPDNS